MSTTGQLAQGPGETHRRVLAVGRDRHRRLVPHRRVRPGREAARPSSSSIPLEGAARRRRPAPVRGGRADRARRGARASSSTARSWRGPPARTARIALELEQDTTYGLPWIDHELALGRRADRRGAAGPAARHGRQPRDARPARTYGCAASSCTPAPARRGCVLPRAAGATTVRAESGAASLTIEVPAGVAARIRSRMALGSSQVDEARFPRVGDGYESPDYATAANRVDIDISGGVGSVKVVSGAA